MATAAKIEQSATTDIVAVVSQNPGLVLLDSEKFDAFYSRMKAETDKLVPDTSTNRGRDEIRSMAARVTRSKTAIDKARLGLTAEWRENVKKANEAGKLIEERLDALADEVRKPLTEWETAEKARVERCREIIADFKCDGAVTLEDTAATVRERGTHVWQIALDPGQFGEMLPEAEAAKMQAVEALKAAFVRLTREEADRAELEKLRAEAAERDAREQAERDAREAKERAEAEAKAEEGRRAAAEQAEAKRLARIEQDAADRAKREAEQAAQAEAEKREREHAEQLAAERHRADEAERAAQAERDRIAEEEFARAAEAKRAADEQAKLEANQKHRSAVMKAAKEAIMTCGVDEDTAKKVVLLIRSGEVPNVSLRF